MKKFLIFLFIPLLVLILGFTGFYTYWNQASPERTCSSCHEIAPSVVAMNQATHRDIRCFECHGTALGNGIHSLREKANMVFTHFSEDRQHEDIHLTEAQVLETSERCASCHQSEHTRWQAGRHATTYSDIFLNPVHNSIERLYWDCFRCHGMYYEGTIYDLVEPISTEGPWSLNVPSKADDPAIPCLACHQIHTENEPYPSLKPIVAVSAIPERNPAYGLYVRSDKMFMRADHLPVPDMYHEGEKIPLSEEPAQRLCVQCHAPGAFHATGSMDDRTPRGVHQGIGCQSCHEPHSMNARNSCISCHPALSNCGLDVHNMNTTYNDPNSPNNIHFVSCEDCHEERP